MPMARPGRPARVHHRVQRGQRDRDVRRMSGDALPLVPRTAWPRFTPSSAEQPVPGSRLLHGDAGRK